MAEVMESVRTLNSVVRTVIALILVGGAGLASWWGYRTYNAQALSAEQAEAALADAQRTTQQVKEQLDEKQRELSTAQQRIERQQAEIVQQKQDIEQKQKEIERLGTAMRLLKVDHRLARLTVVDQTKDEATGEVTTVVEFTELGDDGQSLDQSRRFTIKGDLIYVDNWIVKFDDKYVEQAAIDRATSLVLFRRIFGERQQPLDGFPLDRNQGPPAAYVRGGRVSELEQKIWADFWGIANDENKAKELGIRAAHGQAISVKAQKGKSYRILLRASDGLSIVPEDNAPATPNPKAT